MVVSITNSNINPGLPASEGPVTAVDPAQIALAKNLSTDSRAIGSSFAADLASLEKIQEIKSLPVLNTAANFVKKNASRLFKVAGFAGASLSVLTYFLFNLKSLSILFAVPTAMSFFIAHIFGKSVNEDVAKFSTNPHEILRQAIENPGALETALPKILQAVEQIKDLKDSDPKKLEGVDLVENVNRIVNMKLAQLEGFEDARAIATKNELTRFSTAYDEMKNEIAVIDELHKANGEEKRLSS